MEDGVGVGSDGGGGGGVAGCRNCCLCFARVDRVTEGELIHVFTTITTIIIIINVFAPKSVECSLAALRVSPYVLYGAQTPLCLQRPQRTNFVARAELTIRDCAAAGVPTDTTPQCGSPHHVSTCALQTKTGYRPYVHVGPRFYNVDVPLIWASALRWATEDESTICVFEM